MSANTKKILDSLLEPDFGNPNEEHVFMYLEQYIGEMKINEAKRILRFVMGSSVLTSDCITVCFNTMTGAGRRPIAHTCPKELHLSSNYSTYLEFVEEFTSVLSNEECWSINSQ